MASCGNCGTQVEDGVKFCPSCGKEVAVGPAQQGGSQDAENNKGMAVVAYLLFFVPLLAGAHKKSPFVKYHTNQGTVLFILAVGYSIVSGILSRAIQVERLYWGIPVKVTPGWLSAILSIGSIGITVLCILGIINAVKGRCKPLPLIGGITIIK